MRGGDDVGDDAASGVEDEVLTLSSDEDNEIMCVEEEPDVTLTSYLQNQAGINIDLFESNVSTFLTEDSFLAEHVVMHDKSIDLRNKLDDMEDDCNRGSQMLLLVNIYRTIFNIAPSLYINFGQEFFMNIQFNDIELLEKLKSMYSRTKGANIEMKRGAIGKAIKAFNCGDLKFTAKDILRCVSFASYVLYVTNQIRKNHRKVRDKIYNVNFNDKDDTPANIDMLLRKYRFLHSLKLVPALFFDVKLTKDSTYTVLAEGSLSAFYNSALKICLFTNVPLNTISCIWKLTSARQTMVFSKFMSDHWRNLVSKYDADFRREFPIGPVNAIASSIASIAPEPTNFELPAVFELPVRPASPVQSSSPIVDYLSFNLFEDESIGAFNDHVAVSPTNAPVFEPFDSPLTLSIGKSVEPLETNTQVSRRMDAPRGTKTSRAQAETDVSDEDIAVKYPKFDRYIKKNRCFVCDEVVPENPLQCKSCKNIYHRHPFGTCVLREASAPSADLLIQFIDEDDMAFKDVKKCYGCHKKLTRTAYQCRYKECVGLFCSKCYVVGDATIIVTDTLVSILSTSEQLLLMDQMCLLFRESVLDGININSIRIGQDTDLFEFTDMKEYDKPNGGISQFIIDQVESDRFSGNFSTQILGKSDIESKIFVNATDIQHFLRFAKIYKYISHEHVGIFENTTLNNINDVVATNGFTTYFHMDTEGGHKYFSNQLLGRKLWLFYPNPTGCHGIDQEPIGFDEFLLNGKVCLQEEGTTVVWDKKIIHAVIHLSDTISESGSLTFTDGTFE